MVNIYESRIGSLSPEDTYYKQFLNRITHRITQKFLKSLRVGDEVDLQWFNHFAGLDSRMAKVVEIHGRFIRCQALVGGYYECINVPATYRKKSKEAI